MKKVIITMLAMVCIFINCGNTFSLESKNVKNYVEKCSYDDIVGESYDTWLNAGEYSFGYVTKCIKVRNNITDAYNDIDIVIFPDYNTISFAPNCGLMNENSYELLYKTDDGITKSSLSFYAKRLSDNTTAAVFFKDPDLINTLKQKDLFFVLIDKTQGVDIKFDFRVKSFYSK